MRALGRSVLVGVGALAVFLVMLLASCRDNQIPLLDVTPVTTMLVTGQTTQLSVTRHFSGGPVEIVTDRVAYLSSNRNVAAVDERGLVTAGVEQGTAVVRVSDPSTDASSSLTVTVANTRIEAIELVPSPSIVMRPGTVLQFTAKARLNNGQSRDVTNEVVWASSNERAATVSRNTQGNALLVNALGQGDTTISATDTPTGVKAQSTVLVRGDDVTLTALVVAPNPGFVSVGAARPFFAEGVFSDGSTRDMTAEVRWNSTRTNIVTIDKGTATGVAVGDSTITATWPPTALDDNGVRDGGVDAAGIRGSAAAKVQ